MKQVYSWLWGDMKMASYRTVTSFLFSVGILFQGCDSDVRCRNDNGDGVDWFILYKLPNSDGNGLRYFYMDENTGLTQSTKDINSQTGTLANTLKPLFDFYDSRIEGFGYMLYNDQPPDQNPAAASYGHSKGVVMLDRQTGVWLSHSTPQFPTKQSRDFWPETGIANAQTFLCMTYYYNDFKEIGVQLKYIHAYSYDSDLPTTFPEDLRCVAKPGCYPREEPWFREKSLTSVGGHQFHSFAKYKRFEDDLYSGLIVNSLKQNLFVKSWGRMHSSNHLPSDCTIPHHVYNVKKVKLPNMQPFSDTVDHSKWCVTPGGGWTCVADMNRQISQKRRGGGAICTKDVAVGEAFSALINEHEQCVNIHT